MGTLFVDPNLPQRIGTTGKDSITGTAVGEYIDGLAGSDSISAGGGNDFIVYDSADSRIDGGTGFDSLLFAGTAQSLRLSSKAVTGIEQISLGGGGRHSLTLSSADLIRVSENDSLVVWGDRSSSVNIGRGWVFTGLELISNDQFAVYQNGGAILKTQFDLNVIGYSLNATLTASSASVNESLSAATLSTQVTISVSDPNAGQNLLLPTAEPLGTTLGTLSIGTSTLSNGIRSYTASYQVDNGKVQYLAAGANTVDRFTMTSVDGTTATVSITINGVNNAASISDLPETASHVVEDNTLTDILSVSGSLTVTDPDAGQSFFQQTAVPANGTLGQMTLSAAGSYTYAVSNALVQYLGAGQSKAESFQIYSLDGTAKTVTFTITGVNDTASFNGLAPGSSTTVKEDQLLAATGQLLFTDADAGEAGATTTGLPIAGKYGSLTIAPNGGYVYNVDNSLIDSFGEGIFDTDSFVVTSADGTAFTTLVFTVKGSNDAATFIGLADGSTTSLTEDQAPGGMEELIATGQLIFQDADAGESGFQGGMSSMVGAYGLLSLDTTGPGAYAYAVNNAALQGLGAGITITDVFTVKSADGTAVVPLSFSMTGTNDPATITVPTTVPVMQDYLVQDGYLLSTGKLDVTDIDAGESAFMPQLNLTGTGGAGDVPSLGTLTIEPDGSFLYSVLNESVRYLGASDVTTDTFTVTSLDGTEAKITFTLYGANDAASISGLPAAPLQINQIAGASTGIQTLEGQLSVSDPDANDSFFQRLDNVRGISPSRPQSYGTLRISENGLYFYQIDNADILSLPEGAVITDIFNVTSKDGTATASLVFEVTGANDTAIIGPLTEGSVTQITVDPFYGSGFQQISGAFSFVIDPDDDQSFFASGAFVAVEGTGFGTLVLEQSGEYTYFLDTSHPAIQALLPGETATETFVLSSFDSSAQVTLPITIVGPSAPTQISFLTTSFTVIQDSDPTVSLLTLPVIIQVRSLDSANLDLNFPLFNSLNKGDLELRSTAISGDGLTKTYVFDYVLSNDAVRMLKEGEQATEVFRMFTMDGTTKDLNITIIGENDPAVIQPSYDQAAVMQRTEVGVMLYGTGSISVIDPDDPDTEITVTPAAGNLGMLEVFPAVPDLAGSNEFNFVYSVNNESVRYLPAGATRTEVFTLTTSDGTQQTISLNIIGIDDGPRISQVIGSTSVKEDVGVTAGFLKTTGDLIFEDPDEGENAPAVVDMYTVRGKNESGGDSLGVLTVFNGGKFEYVVPNASVQFLKEGEVRLDVFTVSFLDGTTTEVHFSVIGTDDPVQISVKPQSVLEVTKDQNVIGGTLSAMGELSLFDPDNPFPALAPVASDPDNLGSLWIDPVTFQYTYSVDNSKLDNLIGGQSRIDYFTVVSSDGTGQLALSFTINGTNIPAEIAVTPATTGLSQMPNPDKAFALQASGYVRVIDQDNPYSSVSVSGGAGNLGALSVTLIGPYTPDQSNVYIYQYSVANDSVLYLSAGATKTEVFRLTSSDGTMQDISFTITGADDKSVIGNLPVNASVTEDSNPVAGNLQYTGKLSISDADQGSLPGFLAQFNQTAVVSPGITTMGTLTLSQDGSYTYAVSNDRIQYLRDGETVIESFEVQSLDGMTKTISFTIHGSTDAGLNFTGNTVNTTLYGSDGNDFIRGTAVTAETLYGFDGDDDLAGIGNNNMVYGGAGNDILRGGSGTDSLYGESGNDIYFVGTGDTIFEELNSGTDEVRTGLDFTLPDNVEALTILTHLTVPKVIGTGNGLANTINGSAGNEDLYGMAGDDSLFGNGGDDILYGGAGDDSISFFAGQSGSGYGGDGNDTFIFSRLCTVILDGGNGSDTFQVLNSANSLLGGNSVISDFSLLPFASGGDKLDLPFNPANCIYEVSADSVDILDPTGENLLVTLIGVNFDISKISLYIANGNLA